MTFTLVVDTETTGLPPRGTPIHNRKAWDVCRVVQIAWHLYDHTHRLIEEQCFTIRHNEDVFFNPAAVKIHGITKEVAMSQGVPITEVFDKLSAIMSKVQTIVAHNIAFDDPVIQSEMYRSNYTTLLQDWNTKQKYCTMLKGTRPGERWPKLAVLYERLFERTPDGILHRADTDVAICAEIYFKLISQN